MYKTKYLYFLILIFIIFNISFLSSKEVLFEEIYFQPDSDEIIKNSLSNMDKILKLIKSNKEYIITLKGYTNSTGNPEEELKLSKQRANKIALFFKDKGISLLRIKTAGFGGANLKEQKIAEINRRVEVYVFLNEKEINKNLKIDKDSRKIEIKVIDSNHKLINANIIVQQKKKNEIIYEKIFNLFGKKVIDIPIGDNVELNISSEGYNSKNVPVKRYEEELIIVLNKEGNIENIDENHSIPLVFIKGGTFLMGDTIGIGEEYERPVQKVTVKDYYLGKYEITQKEWLEIMGYNPSEYVENDMPVHNVNWYEAVEYCNRRSENEGLIPYYIINKKKKDSSNKNKSDKINWTVTINESADGYRLPTESEWEYAARGGSISKGYKFSGSNNLQDVGNHFFKIIEMRNNAMDRGFDNMHIVGELQKNELGLYDMTGNVFEWCFDWYMDYELKNQNAKKVENKYKVVRSGFNFISNKTNYVFSRNKIGADLNVYVYYQRKEWGRIKNIFYIGFRVARNYIEK